MAAGVYLFAAVVIGVMVARCGNWRPARLLFCLA